MKKMYLLVWLSFVAILAQAQSSPVFNPDGKAIHGYDPVSFFDQSKPIPGFDSLAYKWNEATWLFATKQNRDLFISGPEKYAPQYGGYCAYGTSRGYKAPTQIDTWTIVDGKLYFNYNKKVQESWNKNRSALIEKADKAWPEIKDKK